MPDGGEKSGVRDGNYKVQLRSVMSTVGMEKRGSTREKRAVRAWLRLRVACKTILNTSDDTSEDDRV